MWNLQKKKKKRERERDTNELIYKTEIEPQTWKLMVTKGKGVGINLQFGLNINTLLLDIK